MALSESKNRQLTCSAIFRVSLLSFLITTIFSCQNLAQVSLGSPAGTLSIQDIRQGQKADIAVSVRGTVVKQVPLVGSQVYELQDDTGTIWILTKQLRLTAGTEAIIQGIIRFQSIPIAGQDWGDLYIEVQEPDSPKSPSPS
jgi:uncharacterized protein YdeI (BOF family)